MLRKSISTTLGCRDSIFLTTIFRCSFSCIKGILFISRNVASKISIKSMIRHIPIQESCQWMPHIQHNKTKFVDLGSALLGDHCRRPTHLQNCPHSCCSLACLSGVRSCTEVPTSSDSIISFESGLNSSPHNQSWITIISSLTCSSRSTDLDRQADRSCLSSCLTSSRVLDPQLCCCVSRCRRAQRVPPKLLRRWERESGRREAVVGIHEAIRRRGCIMKIPKSPKP